MFKHGQFRHSEMQKTCLREKKKQEILSKMSNSVSKECYGSFNIYIYNHNQLVLTNL